MNTVTFTNMIEHNKKDWFADQYEKVIGKPLPRKELTTEEVLQRLKDSAKYRVTSEAKSYKPPAPQTGSVYYLEWKDPQITKCMCPDQDCTCKGGVMLPRKKIPRGEKYYKSPWIRKVVQIFKKPIPPPARNFMQRLADTVAAEASVYKDLENNGILSIKGAEFCTSRCIRYYGAGHFPNHRYHQDKQKICEKIIPNPTQDNDAGKEGRIVDGFLCTVSTQTKIGSHGEFVLGNYSPVLLGTRHTNNTVVRDIEGTELRISSYKCMRDDSQYTTDNVCSLHKLVNWRKLFNLTKFKNRISLLKRNIFSSIIEVKGTDTNVPETNLTIHYEEECVSRESSEKISIGAPKGIIMKVDKKTQNNNSNEKSPEPIRIEQDNNISQDIHTDIYDASISQEQQKQSATTKQKASEICNEDHHSEHFANEISKNKIKHYFKKRLYTLSFRQLKKIEIKNNPDSSNILWKTSTRNNVMSNFNIRTIKPKIESSSVKGSKVDSKQDVMLRQNISKVTLKNKEFQSHK